MNVLSLFLIFCFSFCCCLCSLEQLLQEKKNLHAYLKVYERDFNRTHGRPVMKNEDILPVANEYQRYKELKNIIKELKN
jgi:hypothetical protein